MFNTGLSKKKKKKVKIYISTQSNQEVITETGILTGLSMGAGETTIFVKLDDQKLINIRYIIKIDIID